MPNVANTKKNTRPTGKKVAQLLDEKVAQLQKANDAVRKDSTDAMIAARLTHLVNGGLELLDITSIQSTIQTAAVEYINWLANEGGMAATLFLGWTAKNRKRIVVVLGKTSCRIWASDSVETWEDASGEDIVPLYVSEDSLRKGGEAILGDIGHGITHVYDSIVGDPDTSDNGRHLGKFQETARKFGFEVKKVETNKKFIIKGLNPAGLKFLESMSTDWTEITAWAKANKPANSSETKKGAAQRAKNKNDKAQQVKKANASKASKYDTLMQKVTRRVCPVASHQAGHGLVMVQSDKVAVCPVQNDKNDASKRCLKVMKVADKK